jgi:hypothetical protein
MNTATESDKNASAPEVPRRGADWIDGFSCGIVIRRILESWKKLLR